MAIVLKKAQRKRVKLKIGIASPSGGGKTASSLILAYGLLQGEHPDWSDEQIWEHIAIIDTENGSGELYAGSTIGGTRIGIYTAVPMEPPYEPGKYIEAFQACKDAGMEVCIVDSLSHAWNGQGGLLEKQSNIAKRTGSSFSAWRDISPLYQKLIDSILQTDMHFICTMRSKTEYVQEKDDKGKVSIKKKGLSPIIRDGAEYEFSMFLEIDTDHQVFVSKDRTGTLDGQYFIMTPDTGKKLAKWLDSGAPENAAPKVVATVETPTSTTSPTPTDLPSLISAIDTKVKQMQSDGVDKGKLVNAIKGVMGTTANYNRITEIEQANAVLVALDEITE